MTELPSSPPDSVLSALADAVPHLARPTGWHLLHGGRTNTAWHGTCEGATDVVLKLYAGAARNPLFPNDPNAEETLLRFLAPRGIAPTFMASFDTDHGRCNLYEHLPGDTWYMDTPAVARLMRLLHILPAPEGLRSACDGSAALVRQTLEIVGKCSVMPAFVSDLPEGAVQPSGRQTLLHADIVPGNVIQTDGKLKLIDWQCPAVGDPCEDIAVFLSPAMQELYRGRPLTAQETDAFFIAYDDENVAERYRRLAPFYHARMAAYCLWQVENDRPAYADGLQLEVAALQRSLRP